MSAPELLNASEIIALNQELQYGLNGAWLIITGVNILIMQVGFMALEVGTVRAKNVKACIFKNMFDHAAGAIGWYLIGYPIFIGNNAFASGSDVDWAQTDAAQYAKLFQQFGFCVTCATIVSGGVISRCKLEVYLVFAFLLSSFIYPIASHWCWNSSGFLAQLGYLDFAGSGVVHLLGGSCALVGAKACGPRVGRFAGINERSEDGGRRGSEASERAASEHYTTSPLSTAIPLRYRVVNALCGNHQLWAYNLVDYVTMNDITFRVRAAPGHSASMQCLGALLLYVAWFSFNGGSGGRMDDKEIADVAGRAAINTMLAAGAGSIAGLLWSEVFHSSFDIDLAINTLLGSLVSVTAPCGYIDPWAAIAVGILSVPVYVGCSKLVLYRMKIDDPLNAVAVHAACGLLGLVWLGLTEPTRGLFYSGSGHLLGVQILGALCIGAWGGAIAIVYFYSLKLFILPLCGKRSIDTMMGLDDEDANALCYSHDMQLVGLDFFHFGGSAFPDFDVEAVHEYNATERIKKRYQANQNRKKIEDSSHHHHHAGAGGGLQRFGSPNTSLQQIVIPSPAAVNTPNARSTTTSPRSSALFNNNPLSSVFVMENPNRDAEEED